MASVEGKLASVGVPRLFRAIADERRTGRISLTYSGEQAPAEAEVYFRLGEAYHARVVGRGVQLGARLISAGLISHEDVDQALEKQQAEGRTRRLGTILLEEGLISPETIEAVVRQQIEDTIFEILRWEDGVWRFEPEIESDEDIGLQVSVENLVMEGARRFREWHEISKVVASLEAVPVFAGSEGAPIEVALTPEEWAFVSRVDGKSTITSLAENCGFTEMESARTVAGLVNAGLLELNLPEGVVAAQDDEELDQAFDELERALEEASRDRSAEGHTPTSLEQIIAEIGGVISGDEDITEPRLEMDEAVTSEFEAGLELESPEEVATELDRFDLSSAGSGVDDLLPGLDELPVFDESQRISPQIQTWEESAPQAQASLDPETTTESPPFDLSPEPVGLTPAETDLEPLEPELAEERSFSDIDESSEQIEAIQMLDSIGQPELLSDPEITELSDEFDEASEASEPHQPLFENTPSTNGKDATNRIIAEEPGSGPDLELTSIAQVFADLAKPFDGPDVRSIRPLHQERPVPVSPEQKPNTAKSGWHEGGPVDPNVDVGALIREFSSLGLDDETNHADSTNGHEKSQKGRIPDKGRGLFGKKRK